MSEANYIEAPSPKERSMEEMEEMMKYLQSAIAEKKTATQEAKQVTDDDVKQLLFEGSTHRFLFLDTIKNQDDGTEYKVGCWNKFIAVVVITLQLYSYVQVVALISDYVPCPENPVPTPFPTTIPSTSIMPSFNDGINTGSPTILSTIQPSELQTRPPTGLPTIPFTGSPIIMSLKPTGSPTVLSTVSPIAPEDPVIQETEELLCGFEPVTGLLKRTYYIPAFLLLFCFLSQDLFEGVVLFRCKGCMTKLTALLIFLEAAVAIATACIGTILLPARERLGVLDTFLLIVGIIFVHDVDDQIGYWKNVQRGMGSKYPYSEGIVWTVLLLLAACVLILLGLFIDNSSQV